MDGSGGGFWAGGVEMDGSDGGFGLEVGRWMGLVVCFGLEVERWVGLGWGCGGGWGAGDLGMMSADDCLYFRRISVYTLQAVRKANMSRLQGMWKGQRGEERMRGRNKEVENDDER